MGGTFGVFPEYMFSITPPFGTLKAGRGEVDETNGDHVDQPQLDDYVTHIFPANVREIVQRLVQNNEYQMAYYNKLISEPTYAAAAKRWIEFAR